ncbi:hypothetical protein ABZ281_00395 [Streptomyces sp. NPDC006265]|uniref:hypothetical protein n=1 Tax=Streptomyces sp. NPDC006265 TaxID=3156740 RepID=UPI0033AD6167
MQPSTGLIAAALLTGVVYDAVRPVITTLIDDTFPTKAQQVLVSGWRHFSVNIGATLTGSLGGYLAATVGLPTLFSQKRICLFPGHSGERPKSRYKCDE